MIKIVDFYPWFLFKHSNNFFLHILEAQQNPLVSCQETFVVHQLLFISDTSLLFILNTSKHAQKMLQIMMCKWWRYSICSPQLLYDVWKSSVHLIQPGGSRRTEMDDKS